MPAEDDWFNWDDEFKATCKVIKDAASLQKPLRKSLVIFTHALLGNQKFSSSVGLTLSYGRVLPSNHFFQIKEIIPLNPEETEDNIRNGLLARIASFAPEQMAAEEPTAAVRTTGNGFSFAGLLHRICCCGGKNADEIDLR